MKSFKWLVPLVAIVLIAACGGGSTTGVAEEEGGQTVTSLNTLAVAYPDDLAVTSPLVGGSSESGSLSARSVSSKDDGGEEPFRPQNFVDKREEMGNLLIADSPDDIRMEIDFTKEAPVVGCYGPGLYLSGDHPNTDGPDGVLPALPINDLGIWEETEDGEACIAAQINALMAGIENILNVGLKGAAAALGAANIEGIDLPAAGETDDITDEVTTAFGGGSMPITPELVTIEREAEDNAEGYPVYVTSITADMVGGGEGGPSGFEATLTHIPEVDVDAALLTSIAADESALEDSTYCGRMHQRVSFAASDMQECGPGEGQTECISITYCKDSDTSMTYHMRRAQLCGQDADCFDSNGDVDPAKDWKHNFFYIVAQVNPLDGSGRFAQAWQAGKNDGYTRTFNVMAGCGFYGYGPDVSAASGVGEIDGMICNWAGPGNDPSEGKVMVPKAQRQCIALDSETGVYESVAEELAIRYAPTHSCDKAAGTFAYGIQDPPTDVPVGAEVLNNLIDVEDVDFTIPGLPVVSD